MRNIFFIFFLALLFLSCANGRLILNTTGENIQQQPQDVPSFTIYALGDAGEVNDQSRAVMQQLSSVTGVNQQPGIVIFLGDNIYHSGLPPEWNIKAYHKAHDILMNQIYALSAFTGKIIFIPGNHDWNDSKAGGLEAIRRQGKYLDQLDPSRIRLLPQNGCGGPVPVVLNDDLVMLIIDSQWWLQDWTIEPKMNEGCDIQSKDEFITAFREQVALYRDKQIVVAMHHPLYTQGSHGGHFTLKNHLFPLTSLVKWLYLPLPVIGSFYPFIRWLIKHPQDLKNHMYKSLREDLLKDLDYDGEMIFLSGHEHCLQYIRRDGDHFLVSGAGSRQTAISDGKNLVYGHKAGGFMELDFYVNNSVWLSVYEVDPARMSSRKVFSRPIIEK